MNEYKDLNKLESAVLEYMFSIDNENAQILKNQLQHATVINRNYTGHGFFTDISIDKEKCEPTTGIVEINKPLVQNESLPYGGGFLIYLVDGYLECLEGFAYSDDWPKDIKEFTLTPTPWKTSVGSYII